MECDSLSDILVSILCMSSVLIQTTVPKNGYYPVLPKRKQKQAKSNDLSKVTQFVSSTAKVKYI